MLRRQDRGARGFWQPVTGVIEEGEKRIEALKGEVTEETGIKNAVRIIENVQYDEFFDFFKREARQHLIREYVFGVEINPNEKIVIDGREHNEYRWCGFEQALKLLKLKENKEALKG